MWKMEHRTPKGLPLEPKIVIKNIGDRRNVVSDSYAAFVSREEITDDVCVTNEIRKQERNKAPYQSTKHVKKHASVHHVNNVEQDGSDDVTVINVREKEPEYSYMLPYKIQRQRNVKTIATGIGHTQKVNNTITDLEYATETEPNGANISNNLDIEMTQSLKPDDLVSEDKNEIVNKFLNELHDKTLKLENKFSDHEIKDIRAAVLEIVTLLAKAIGEIDPRLRIQEVIPVGSAREDTQIIRPYEFDYILTLDALSRLGVVSLESDNTDEPKFENKYVNIKLKDDDVKHMFQECSKNNYLRGSHLLPCFRHGLREVFCSAVYQAVYLNSTDSIKMTTGKLKVAHTKPESHGPAFMIRLIWERAIMDEYTPMEISIDLCPALEFDMERFKSEVLSSYHIFPKLDFIESIGSVLLMPREEFLFNVAFTEKELLYTSHLSQHHLKCYKLLKYLVNGEPFPRERPTNRLIRPFLDSKTVFHSYELKNFIWKHQYGKKCTEESDLYSCIDCILRSLERDNSKHGKMNSILYMWLPMKLGLCISISSLRTLQTGLKRIKNTHVKKYKFDTFCHVVKSHGLRKFPARTCSQILSVLFIVMSFLMMLVFFFISISFDNKIVTTLNFMMFLFSIAAIIFGIVTLCRDLLVIWHCFYMYCFHWN